MKTYKTANWPAPKNVTAITSTIHCGNLAKHVGDIEHDVQRHRELLIGQVHLKHEPIWLNQTHSTHCIVAEHDERRDADAATTRSKNHPLVILTADCLPILLCNTEGTEVAAIHAGWRGLCNGIVENTLESMQSSPQKLMAWIGPAICGSCFEVGEEVLLSFTDKHPEAGSAFVSHKPNKWHGNLPKIAEMILHKHGVTRVFQSNL